MKKLQCFTHCLKMGNKTQKTRSQMRALPGANSNNKANSLWHARFLLGVYLKKKKREKRTSEAMKRTRMLSVATRWRDTSCSDISNVCQVRHAPGQVLPFPRFLPPLRSAPSLPSTTEADQGNALTHAFKNDAIFRLPLRLLRLPDTGREVSCPLWNCAPVKETSSLMSPALLKIISQFGGGVIPTSEIKMEVQQRPKKCETAK